MKSPFKFLDAYTLKDRDAFFGREQEVEQLFEMTTENRLMLVYGQSGTGKTSLVQCGLASRFYRTDWYPMFIRRGEDINAALAEALAKPLSLQTPPPRGWGGLIEELYATFLRPIYLIFDQLEELFILGSPEEQSRFIHTIAEITEANLPCRILFILREEYLAYLYGFEKVIPNLFDRRLRVEPMSLAKVGEVIGKSCARFNITLEEPERNVQQIIDNVSAEKSGIQLPYLQVYLDMLWREDYERTYSKSEGGNRKAETATAEPSDFALPTSDFPPLLFTSQEISQFGQIDDVLHQFLLEQEEVIGTDLRKAYPDLPEQAVRQVLDVFVTPEGTKRPVHFHREAIPPSGARGPGLIIVEESVQKLLLSGVFSSPPAEASQEGKIEGSPHEYTNARIQSLPGPPKEGEYKNTNSPLTAILEALEQSRILRFGDDAIELAHDSLARLIDEQRTEEQRQLNEVKNRIASAYREWERTEQQEYLTRKQLDSFEALLPKVQLELHLRDFAAASRAVMEEKEQRERRRRRLFIGAILLVAGLMGVATVISYRAQLRAEASEKRAKERRVEADSARHELALMVDSLDATIVQLAEQKQIARDSANYARKQEAIAQDALSQSRIIAGRTVTVLLSEANNYILALQYDNALVRAKAAWNLNAGRTKVARTFQEIAFFFTESGAYAEAEAALAYIGRKPMVSNDQPGRQEALLAVIEKMDASYMKNVLEKRYYPEMVKIAGGTFCLDTISFDCDTSRHLKVRLDSFQIARTETTVWQYYLFINATSREMPEMPSWQWWGNNPIVNVNWYDAIVYANWVSDQKSKDRVYKIKRNKEDPNNLNEYDDQKWIVRMNPNLKGYRLPTEAEWAYAGRGGQKSRGYLYSGDSLVKQVAWINMNSLNRTQAVRLKKGNELGLFDMSGNVWEWCWDWWGELSYGDVDNPEGAETGKFRVLRGGSWEYQASIAELGYRYQDGPVKQNRDNGFRLSMSSWN